MTRSHFRDITRVGRTLRRIGVGTAATLTAVALLPHGARAASADGSTDGSGPSVWQGEAVASGIQVVANEKGFLLPEIVNANVPDGDSVANSSNQDKSRASTFYPGLAVSQGPSLLCTAGVPCPPGFPPAWPLSAYAQYPSQPTSSVSTTQSLGGQGAPISLLANSAEARAEPAGTRTSATVSDLSVPGGQSVQSAAIRFQRQAALILARPVTGAGGSSSDLLHVGSAKATTSVAVTGGALVSQATSLLHDVELLGGIVDIGSVSASSLSTTDGAGLTKADSSLVMGTVTVAGQQAAIDASGIHVVSSPALGGDQVDQLNKALAQALASTGWQVELLGATRDKTADSPRASAKGLMFYAQGDASSVPAGSVVYSSFLLGSADSQAAGGADSNVTSAASDLTAPLTSTGGDGGPVPPAGVAPAAAPLGGDSALGGALGADGGAGSAALAGSGGSGSLPAAASGPAAPGRGRFSGRLASDGVAAGRTTIAYLTAALLALALGLGAPWLLPALAGRSRSERQEPPPRR